MKIPLVTTEATGLATRDTLLLSACGVFAERGYANATVREICVAAGANIASVNYHFGSKEEFYLEVVKHTIESIGERFAIEVLPIEATPEEELHAFVLGFLHRLFASSDAGQHGRLLARELFEPTSALDLVIERWIRPAVETLRRIVSSLSDGRLRGDDLDCCCLSVLSQALFYLHCQPLVVRVHPQLDAGKGRVELLAEHITRFSISAIRGMESVSLTPQTRNTERARNADPEAEQDVSLL